jgi:hypothetical protein
MLVFFVYLVYEANNILPGAKPENVIGVIVRVVGAGLLVVLLAVGSLLAVQSRQERAVSILAAVDSLRREMGFEFQAHTLADYESALQLARDALSKERFEAAWQGGGAMSLEEAASYAMSEGTTV